MSAREPHFLRFLRKNDVITVMESSLKTLSKPLTDLSELNNERTIVYKLDNKQSRLNDGQIYSRNDKSSNVVIQPKYGSVRIDGQDYETVKSSSITTPGLHRTIVQLPGSTIVHYFLDNGATYFPPDEVKHRMTEEDIAQIRNQQKHVPTSIKANFGRKGKTDVATLSELHSIHPSSDFSSTFDSNQKQQFRYCHLFEKIAKVYINGCPTKQYMEDWVTKVERVLSLGKTARDALIEELYDETETEVKFPSRLYCDTTFNVTDAYVTIVYGELSEFQARKSRKHICLPVAIMIHTEKVASEHEHFAKFLAKHLKKLNSDKKVPSLTVDGEIALRAYAKELECFQMRCEIHLASNLKEKCTSEEYGNAKKFLFGEMIGDTWKRGILDSFSVAEFEKKLIKMEQEGCSSEIISWLKRNKRMLLETVSAATKLKAGNAVFTSSTNAIENYNKNLKGFLLKLTPADELMGKLESDCNKKYQELLKSLHSTSDSVVFLKYHKFIYMKKEERETELKLLGFSPSVFLSWDIPTSLRKTLDERKMEEAETESENWKCVPVSSDIFVLNNINKKNDFVNVFREDAFSSLQCSICKNGLPLSICAHLISTLKTLTQPECRSELDHLGERSKQKSMISLTSQFKNSKTGRKIGDRKGTKLSSNNRIRKIGRMTDVSLFDGTTSVANTVMFTDSDSESDKEDSSVVSYGNINVGNDASGCSLSDSTLIPTQSTPVNGSDRQRQSLSPTSSLISPISISIATPIKKSYPEASSSEEEEDWLTKRLRHLQNLKKAQESSGVNSKPARKRKPRKKPGSPQKSFELGSKRTRKPAGMFTPPR